MEEELIWEYAEKAAEMLDDATLTEALNFELIDSEPDLFTSKIGGTPYLPHGAAIPTDSDGRQMKLLAQFDCALLTGMPDFPHEGMLQFWLNVKYPWKEWKITYHKEIDRTVTEAEVLAQTVPFTEGETGEFPVIGGGYGIEPELVKESMSGSDKRYGLLVCKYLNELTDGKYFAEHDDAYDLFDPEPGSGHKLGGYLYDPQSWVRYVYEPDADIELGTEEEALLLFQLEYEHGFGENWADGAKVILGDCGCMHFFIKRCDLKALRFDKAWYDWNCS